LPSNKAEQLISIDLPPGWRLIECAQYHWRHFIRRYEPSNEDVASFAITTDINSFSESQLAQFNHILRLPPQALSPDDLPLQVRPRLVGPIDEYTLVSLCTRDIAGQRAIISQQYYSDRYGDVRLFHIIMSAGDESRSYPEPTHPEVPNEFELTVTNISFTCSPPMWDRYQPALMKSIHQLRLLPAMAE
jgi:hypothetical protein